MTRVVAVRLDSEGDVLLCGPAVRALAATGDVDLLASPAGAAAGRLLPGVRDVLVFDAPWSGYVPPPVDATRVARTVAELAARRYERAVVLTSAHQSPLPTALLLRLAGVRFVAADCDDYPGSLLDLRHRRAQGRHEVQAALDLAVAAGGRPVPTPDGRPGDALAVRTPLPDVSALLPGRPFVVLHPGASVPARAPAPDHATALAVALAAAGRHVVVTGGPTERALTAHVAEAARTAAHAPVTDLGGRTDLAALAAVLAAADAVVVGNTGPAHLAAAVGTPVVSLFAPVVPADRWRPWGVPHVVLGDQEAPCAATRARACPVPGHPCLTGIDPRAVVDAVDRLAPVRQGVPA
ncbi:glycosyltransferase family 9 protein [Cellulomonas fimi]|uniref:Glycosyl transferase family 9 n=1 Tax=Cellulomonas fimi (strain ATCC 484 / DSM 20113 / JCM 1341 / CCUG 24087 / LMG 16345 / NBRC 15513 / NCIMB 8980 / NCTC 7547 / NRS-133) TaxID=590998 RepID=F4H5Y8_CELFA|nr:glycosyltransferase family 9 protein [Cellulomonas fimi]AEE46718.1 glycosyl transferase family 9 [Cellulomonas fimi ATCC 484]NNH07637.1 glycosyltransferase family 9 protein [Cellulomonas fimi]VEH33976.1 Lipopolysaccharide core heptosyltransferase rfaQ [Cellulomonas fimi]